MKVSGAIFRTKHCVNRNGGIHSCAARQEGNYTLTQSSDSHSWSSVHKKHTGRYRSVMNTSCPSHTKHWPRGKVTDRSPSMLQLKTKRICFTKDSKWERLETYQCFVWDRQLVFMTERYRYASCALMIKNGNHLTASMCNSLLDEQHKNASHHFYSRNALSLNCTASYDANLSRERFVPFGRTFGAPYSQLDTR